MARRRVLRVEIKVERDNGAPSGPEKRGDEAGWGLMQKRCLRAATGQVELPSAAETNTDMPLQNGSVLDPGKSRQTWAGVSKEGRKVTEDRVRCTEGLNFLLVPSMNSPQ